MSCKDRNEIRKQSLHTVIAIKYLHTASEYNIYIYPLVAGGGGWPVGHGPGPDVDPLQLGRRVVDGDVHQGVTVVQRLPRRVHILQLRRGEHVVSTCNMVYV